MNTVTRENTFELAFIGLFDAIQINFLLTIDKYGGLIGRSQQNALQCFAVGFHNKRTVRIGK